MTDTRETFIQLDCEVVKFGKKWELVLIVIVRGYGLLCTIKIYLYSNSCIFRYG